MKIYILGITGMLGSKLFQEFFEKNYKVRGSSRLILKELNKYKSFIDSNIDVYDLDKLKSKIMNFKPEIIINCIGLIKQKINKIDEKDIFYINSIFPHELYKISELMKAKLIHFSTDCVFDGKTGNYDDNQIPNALDVYGFSKKLGEINYKNSLTIRTSIIGHEMKSKYSLLEWFLNKKKNCEGYSKAYFSGLPTIEIFEFLEKYILNNKNICGIYNLSSNKISKFELLNLIAKTYSKNIKIKKNRNFKIDRSLNSKKLKKITSYKNPSWNQLVKKMFKNHMNHIQTKKNLHV
tara:strand:- start:699 stop:1577 length:879 start_codon:yes stop_codon:yes gene_type:complete